MLIYFPVFLLHLLQICVAEQLWSEHFTFSYCLIVSHLVSQRALKNKTFKFNLHLGDWSAKAHLTQQ